MFMEQIIVPLSLLLGFLIAPLSRIEREADKRKRGEGENEAARYLTCHLPV